MGAETQTIKNLFLIDDEEAMRVATRQWLELSGWVVVDFAAAGEAVAAVAPDFDGVIISDVKMSGMDGLALLDDVRRIDREIPVILITGHGDVPMAVDALKRGAYDFLEKPFAPERLIEVVDRALDKRRLVLQNRDLKRLLDQKSGLDARLIGRSSPMSAIKDEILNLAGTRASVLISGETGTGKEVVAKCLHDFGGWKEGPFVAVNCAAIPENMVESELFGHEAGAFTGAVGRRIGHLEHANGGTLFLDEIGSMPLEMQSKLLRALENREITRLGASMPVPVDFRLVSAANEDLNKAVSEGRFREDLFYRINTVELTVAPLRERREDIPLLFQAFASQAAETYDREFVQPDATATALLLAQDWPGNVRQLKNIAERYVLSSAEPADRMSRILNGHPGMREEGGDGTSLADQVRHFERHLIKDALKRYGGNVKAVMEELDIPRRTLNEKMVKYGIARLD
ncbi:sigma-54-dependent transcriptional regulator [Aestuariispira ectoiniformans]|uniref:sigma-54-dependent transcriptional regulator n=1 Tax=Aestuariispira ectoiniformans TaxID=2775080 RepID=UPI00223B0072|nr:sigma-54 dependent transcriptional regulator [Aestuariispira ectoiniformans]